MWPCLAMAQPSGQSPSAPASHVTLTAFFDADADGIFDESEPLLPFARFSVAGPDGVRMVDTSTGSILLNDLAPANYSFGFTPSHPSFSCAASYDLAVGYNTNLTLLFPVTAPAFTDLSVHLVAVAPPKPGFPLVYRMHCENRGTVPASGTMVFTKDGKLGMAQSCPEGAAWNASGFTLPFAALMPFERRDFEVVFQVPVLPYLSLGDVITATATVQSDMPDAKSANDSFTVKEVVVGSYDPNDICEMHGPVIGLDQFAEGEVLVYTIRFENTGTAAADFVIIEDVLGEQLDAPSAYLTDASHPVMMGRVDNKVRFLFPGINLEPSVPDTPVGKGHVSFAVKPTGGYGAGTVIPNQAHIFFDFNPAIATNVWETTFVPSLSAGVSPISALRIWPNPVADRLHIETQALIKRLTLRDVWGRVVLMAYASPVDCAGIPSGMYLLEVETEQGNHVTKILK